MKFKKIFFVITISLSLLVPALGLAKVCAPGSQPVGDTELCNPIVKVGGNTFTSFGINVLRVFASIAGIVTIIYVMFSGFRFIISQGNSEEVEAAKRSLQWSISGFILMLLSFVLVTAITGFFNIQTIPGNDDPKLTNPIAANSFNDLYLLFINGFFTVVGLLTILMIMVNGFRYVTSRGNEEQAQTAKTGLQYAIGGIIIVLLAYVLVRATATFFGASN